jgi:hypothetical protein
MPMVKAMAVELSPSATRLTSALHLYTPSRRVITSFLSQR